MNKLYSFSKSEHLCGDKRIARLFAEGEAFIAYPMRVVFIVEPKLDTESISVMVSVPKKRFKRAVKRNRLKRLMREAFRLNKNIIRDVIVEKELQVHVAFHYISDDELDLASIEKKMITALNRILIKVKLFPSVSQSELKDAE